MNMHGIMVPQQEHEVESRTLRSRRRLSNWLQRRKMFLLIVVLPTMLVAGYYYLIASNQYESEAHFIVRTTGPQAVSGLGVSQAISAMTGMSATQNDAMSVADYLTSHDVVATLRREAALTEKFQRADIDPVSRLRGTNPSPEKLLKYYLDHVAVKFNTETGIATLRVHAFRPQDSYDLAEKLLSLGERRVNLLNDRSYKDSIANAQRQLADTERELAAVQTRLTHFRQSRSDIDPKASGQAQLELVSKLRGDLSAAQAQLNGMSGMINRSSPQYAALAGHIRALQGQIAAQSGRLTGDNRAIAQDIGGYEDLQMRQTFLTQTYAGAAAALDRAREQAQRQQLYLVRIVEPNMPVKSLYPERGRIVLTVLIALLISYALGWLLAAGTREHAA